MQQMTLVGALRQDPGFVPPALLTPPTPVSMATLPFPFVLFSDRDTHHNWLGVGPFEETSYDHHDWGELVPNWTLPRLVTIPFGLDAPVSVCTPIAWLPLSEDTPWPSPIPFSPFSLNPIETPTDWAQMMGHARATFESGIQKIVLARRAQYHDVPTPLVPSILGSLYQHNQGVYRLIMAHSMDHGMVSLSPEPLFRRQGTTVQIDALAGTRTKTGPSIKWSAIGSPNNCIPSPLPSKGGNSRCFSCNMWPIPAPHLTLPIATLPMTN
ncbi:hypothetical protein EBZ35_03135 [bacterium]|nr:hypothetical protein [bacterium]